MITILLFTYGFPKNYDDNYAIKLVDKLPTQLVVMYLLNILKVSK